MTILLDCISTINAKHSSKLSFLREVPLYTYTYLLIKGMRSSRVGRYNIFMADPPINTDTLKETNTLPGVNGIELKPYYERVVKKKKT